MNSRLESYKSFAETIVKMSTRDDNWHRAVACVADEIEQYVETKIRDCRIQYSVWDGALELSTSRLAKIDSGHTSVIPVKIAKLADSHLRAAYLAFKASDLKTTATELEYARKLSSILSDDSIEVGLIAMIEQIK